LSAYRGRNRTLWSVEEREDKSGEEDEDEGPDLTHLQLSPKQEVAVMNQVSYSNDLANTIKGSDTTSQSSEGNGPGCYRV
jgi:hypothetical protein